MQSIQCAPIILMLAISLGCASIPKTPISPHGKVIDKVSGKPLANAFVVAQFVGDGPYNIVDPGAGVKDHCFGSLVTKTDEAGHFDFSRESPSKLYTKKYNNNLHVNVTAYKPGYSHEVDKGYVSWMNGHLVFINHVKATSSGVTLSVVPEQKSAYANSYDRLAMLPSVFCGSKSAKTRNHWLIMQAIMEESKKNAKSSRDWAETWRLCNILNKINENMEVNESVENCEGLYKPKVKAAEEREKVALKRLVQDLDWADGPALELVNYQIKPGNAGNSVFLIRNRPEGIGGKELLHLLQKVCESDYPGDFFLGSACIYFGAKPEGENSQRRCDARVKGIHLSIFRGVAEGTTMQLDKGWCPRKTEMPYYWID